MTNATKKGNKAVQKELIKSCIIDVNPAPEATVNPAPEATVNPAPEATVNHGAVIASALAKQIKPDADPVPEKSKQQIAYEKQLAALIAVGFSQADAEKALAAIKPVARQAAEEMPPARWQLAKALSTLALVPVTEKHTEESTYFDLFVDAAAMATDAKTLKADVAQFLNKSTFANACKNGKKVLFNGGLPMTKADAADYASDYITGKFLFLIGLLQAEQKKYFEALRNADSKAGV